ncbi:MAG: cytochrome P450 [Candidatus Binatia bacterium]
MEGNLDLSQAAAQANENPPGPRGWPLVGSLPAFYRDPLGFNRRIADRYGDVALVRIAGLSYYVLSNPDDIEAVLVTKNRDFRKGRLGAERRLLFGNGLATSDGDFWRRQRRLAQPAFHRERIAAYGESMVAFTEEMSASWRDGEVRDLHADMMRVTLRNVAHTLFGTDASREAAEVAAALEVVMRFLALEEGFFLRLLPRGLPTPGRVRFRRAVARLDRIVFDLIARRRGDASDTGDLLSMLLAARDEDGSQMSDQQLRDETMTLFLAGHETTALALSWTFALLAEHPEIEGRLVEEVSALGGRPPRVADLPRLRYAEKVVKESMRLYPPAWILARQALRDVEIGGYRIPAHAFVVMSQWVVHRDPRHFVEPKRFLPERWSEDFERRLPRHAYFPFGGGQRVCIGAPFAMMEAILVLATIAQRFRFSLLPGRRVVPEPSLSLRPKGGVWGVVTRRMDGRS